MEHNAVSGAVFVLVPEPWTALGAARLVERRAKRQPELGTIGSPDGIQEVPSADALRHSWVPLEHSRLPEELAALANADDVRLRDWVAAHGRFGVETQRITLADGTSAKVEFVVDIQETLDVLRNAIGLRDTLRDPGASPETVMGAMQGCTWREPTGLASLGVSLEGISPKADPRVRALNVLGHTAAIGMGKALGLGDPAVTANVVGDESEVRARAELHPLGPIPCAFALLFAQALEMRIRPTSGRVRQGQWAPRSCARCGRVFNPRTQTSAWCSKRCRWAASKAGIANPWTQPDLSAEQFRQAVRRDPARAVTKLLSLGTAEQHTLVQKLRARPKRPSINSSDKGA